MFESTSRYAEIENEKLTLDIGQVVAYKKRRFVPFNDNMILLQEVVVSAGDRLDTITSRVLGDPEQFWRICDANDAMNPFDLVSEPGKVIRIALTGK
jgi:hypothetical protein